MKPERSGPANKASAILRFAAAAITAAGLVAAAFSLHGNPAYGRNASFSVLSGAAFGMILQRSRFCFASAFRDFFLFRDRRVALGILAALAVGSIGYQVIFGAWIPDPSAGYFPLTAHIAPAGWHLLIGGFAFGVGMVLAGGCISGNLYRLGEGSMTAPVALIGAAFGFWIGFLSWNFLYVNEVATAPVIWLPKQFGFAGSLAIQLAVLGVLTAFLIRLTPGIPRKREEALNLRSLLRKFFVDGWPAVWGGVAIGVLATFVFLRTRPLGVTSEIGRLSRIAGNRLETLPERLEGLDGIAGCATAAGTASLTENALFVLALVAGSLFAALIAGEFRLRLGRPRTYLLSFIGGILLGFGAMISLGCTIGTMLSGIMAFSLSGWVFVIGLFGGTWAGGLIFKRLA